MTKDQILRQLSASRLSKIPTGFKMMVKISKEWDMSLAGTSSIVRKAVLAGLCVRKDFYIEINGVIKKVPHYRFK